MNPLGLSGPRFNLMFTFTITLFLLLILGHTTAWIAIVNRTHSLPWKPKVLQQIRHVHDILVLLFPLILVWELGLTGPKLFFGGEWKEVSAFWYPIFLFCGVGLVWFCIAAILRLASRIPVGWEQTQSCVWDISQLLGRRPIANDRSSLMARFPINDQFQFELNEKTFTIPDLPAEWDGMTILHLSDWHFMGTVEKEYFTAVTDLATELPVDLVCFTGDLIDDMETLSWLPETLGRFSAPLGCYFILGNHDWYQNPVKIREAMTEQGWTDVGLRSVVREWKSRKLEIAGDETPWMNRPPQFQEAEAFRLLLSHTPDHFSRSQKLQVDLMLSGHNHGGQIRLPVIGPVYSPSWYGGRYASGVFYSDPTWLHVSRGLSGNYPLRWRCLPEVTRIVLKKSPQ